MGKNGYGYKFLVAEGIKMLFTGQIRGLVTKINLLASGKSNGGSISPLSTGGLVYVWSSPHTLFLAEQISDFFKNIGISVELVTSKVNKVQKADLEIVLSPAYFDFPYTRAPRIVYQLEQTTSARWFTAKYVDYMKESAAIFEYSLFNIPTLLSLGLDLEKIFYVPLGGSSRVFRENSLIRSNRTKLNSTANVLTYGDFQGSTRRAYFLKTAQEQILNLRHFGNTFGVEMHNELSVSDIVVNVNYYSPAICATPRLWESLSFGNVVVSERALNCSEYPELHDLVDFADVDDFQSLISIVKDRVNSPVFDFNQRLEKIVASEDRFRFMMTRALFGIGSLVEKSFTELIKASEGFTEFPIVLSMPETIERRQKAVKRLPENFVFFDGVKKSPGWIGCANSYRILSKALLEQNVAKVIICEDDVILPPNFDSEMSVINRYLDSLEDEWDIFVGLTADFDYRSKISKVADFEEKRFLHTNLFTSTVFNIYSRSGLEKFASWEIDSTLSTEQNTIDRFLNRGENLRIITLEEDIFLHDENQSSTLWGINNYEYNPMIGRSRYIKKGLIKEWFDSRDMRGESGGT